MRFPGDNSKSRILTVVLVLLCLLFSASLFKNIGYPLFWADESMTVMGGVRVLEFGYPKVHDGKNVFYDLLHPNTRLGIDEKTDAYIGGANWGQYYVAAIGVKLAEMSNDLFTKTAIIRLTFALIGLAGLVILAFLGSQFFDTSRSKTGFLALFVFFALISVPLALHLREARYYPLTIFLTALTIFVYARYRILKNTGYPAYGILLVLSLFSLFVTFSPAYFVFLFSILIFESMLLAGQLVSGYRDQAAPPASPPRKVLFLDYLRTVLPVFISLIIVLPLLVFFKTFFIAREMTKYNDQLFGTDEIGMFWGNIEILLKFFSASDFLYLAIFLKICLLVCFVLRTARKNLPPFDLPKVFFSNFLAIFFIVYFVSIARIPNFPFTRYIIPLQPVLTLIIILDIAVIYNFIFQYPMPAMRRAGGFLVVIVTGFIVVNMYGNANYLKGHLYEISNQYQGPLDYVIPFIKENYPNPENLVIATNYEETSFMYYLGSRVIVGYVGNNLEDARTQPDIIVYRKLWANFQEVFRDFVARQAYERISFPVMDYAVNNLPELNWKPPIHHRFRTPQTSERRGEGRYVCQEVNYQQFPFPYGNNPSFTSP